MASFFDPSFRGAGSPGAPGVGTTQRGLQLVEQGKNVLSTQQLGLERAQAAQPGLITQDQLSLEQAQRGAQREISADERESLISGAEEVGALKSRPAQLQSLIRRSAEIVARDGNPEHTDQGIQLLQEGLKTGDFTAFDESINSLISLRTAGKGLTAGQREFTGLTKGLSAEEIAEAKRIKLGLDPRATGAASKIFDVGGVPHIFDPVTQKAVPVEIEGKDVTTKTVSESEAIIAGRVKQAKDQAAISTGIVKSGFKAIQSINKNMLNLDRAITLLEGGAKTGAIERFLPSIRAASVELDQVRGELGLDVVSAVTFGALSAGELGLALGVALPTGLDEAELIDHLNRRKDAQSKLLEYYNEQIQFLSGKDEAGNPNTIAKFLQSKRQPEAAPDQPTGGQELSESDIIINPSTGQRMQVVDGQLVAI